MAAKGMNLVMILGSVRNGRMADRVSRLVRQSVTASTKLAVKVIDPLIVDPSCILNRQPMHFLADPQKEASRWMEETNEIIRSANGFIVICSEYNGNMPPALLNLMNCFPPTSFRHRPAGIVTYTMGTTGAMRSLNVVRPYLSELGLLCVPGYVPIPLVHENVDEKGSCKNQLVIENLEKLVKNVEWYSQAIHAYKSSGNSHID